ncbi:MULTISPECIES: hypothetical protein [Nonomuraea]|uniref:Uncharacterized protein n=2 Tax=Nonomuraea TaxID=83681 RepID=A0A7X0U4R3_9ACTN|nr:MULTISPECIES: hypothetical protein [Nonomuraea]MBB6554745.1 hypothetical protein [Nonomuraea rubra]MCP2361158.1 hypothetical protein [Nonomuraea thailandensis]
MAQPARAVGTGLVELTDLTLLQLVEVDEATLDRAVRGIVGRRGPWDRLWQEDSASGHGAVP